MSHPRSTLEKAPNFHHWLLIFLPTITTAAAADDDDISLLPAPVVESTTAPKNEIMISSTTAAASEEEEEEDSIISDADDDDDAVEFEAMQEEDSESNDVEVEGSVDDDDDDIRIEVSVNDDDEEEDADRCFGGNAKGEEASSSYIQELHLQSNSHHKEKMTKEQHQQHSSGRSTASQDSNDSDSADNGGRPTKKGSGTSTVPSAATTAGIQALKFTPSTSTSSSRQQPQTSMKSDIMMMLSSSFSPPMTSLHPSPHPPSHSSGAATTTTNNNNQKGGYQGMYRSAAAAHKHRQISIPPIGSPGLLMIPTLANTAMIHPPIATEADKKKWFVKLTNNKAVEGEEEEEEEYILPSTVFQQSMIAGGYTYNAPVSSSSSSSSQKHHGPEQEHDTTTTNNNTTQILIERGSSTERNVGDMFDSDAGGLYLHFPELIPCSLWKRRFGYDKSNINNNNYNYNIEEEQWRNNEKMEEYSSANTATRVKNENGNQVEGEASTTTTAITRGPKGARSSYIFFTNDQRPLMMAQFPGMRFTEQGIIMGERWRALTPEEKRPYESMALEDKERYAREMKEYIASVKKEVQEEKEQLQQLQQENNKREEDQDAEDEEGRLEKRGENNSNPSRMSLLKEETTSARCSSGEGIECVVGPSTSDELQEKGQRVVDVMILSLCKILGEHVSRREMITTEEDDPKPAGLSDEIKSKAMYGTADASGVQTATAECPTTINDDCSPNNTIITPSQPRRVSPPDLTVDELPRFTPHPSQPQTRPRPRPYAPLSFLDMIPISLTSTYPSSYVERRRAYAQAVKDREHAIVEAQEAKDDHDDAQEKYAAHVEAWDRMLEYQKVQIAKREAEAKREREEEILKQLEDGVGTIIHRPTTPPPPEDPMDCMPPRPEPPGPARAVAIPDIPIPPSPPPVVEMDEDEVDDNNMNGNVVMNIDDGDNSNDISAAHSSFSSSSILPMRVPKLNKKLLRHLDPACFLPSMSGRYFGLSSNHVSDPQFCGILAPGIAGNTFGGGTGLATSYTGGGRGAMGLVSGPSRGGSMWQTPAGVGSSRSSNASIEKRPLLKEKSVIPPPLEVTSSSTAVSPPVIASSSSASDDKKSPMRENDAPLLSAEKRPAPSSEITSGSDKKNKKQKRSPCLLTTGDRNTTATEIASGSAGPEFPDGWVIKTYRRSGGETIGKTDRFWFSPGRNIRFRARKHAMAFVEILNEEHVGGDEDKAAEIYRVRGLHF